MNEETETHAYADSFFALRPLLFGAGLSYTSLASTPSSRYATIGSPSCVASSLLCLLLATHSEAWFGGYQVGFELLLYNAALTAFGLWTIRKK